MWVLNYTSYRRIAKNSFVFVLIANTKFDNKNATNRLFF